MPGRAAAALQQPAVDRESRIVEIEIGQHRPDLLGAEQFGIDSGEPHRIAAPGEGVALGVGMVEVQDAALADHGVVVQILLQPLPELHRELVERRVARQQIVRADDRGVAADIAGAEIALLQHRDIADAVPAGEVMRRRQAMTAAADDDDVVFGLRRGIAPGRGPALVALQGLRQQREDGITHRWVRAVLSSRD